MSMCQMYFVYLCEPVDHHLVVFIGLVVNAIVIVVVIVGVVAVVADIRRHRVNLVRSNMNVKLIG
jgi:hypothetical protein